MIPLSERLRREPALIADGAMGSLLIERGLPPGACPERLNLEQPAWLRDIARLYAQAGADMVQTNTFGASPIKLSAYGLADRTEAINRRAVELARAGAGQAVYVTGTVGPCGKLLKPYGEADPADVRQSFERQTRALVEAGVDAISIETMTDLREAILAVQAARAVSPTIPILASLTYDATPRGVFTIMGDTVAKAAAELAAAGADAVGSNCGNGSEPMKAIAEAYRRHTDLPLVIQPNAGLPEIRAGLLVYPETPEFMAAGAAELCAAGVRVIGGCCGTTPAHIAAIKARLRG